MLGPEGKACSAPEAVSEEPGPAVLTEGGDVVHGKGVPAPADGGGSRHTQCG